MDSLIKDLSLPAVQLRAIAEPSRCYFGGDPGLPSSVVWPSKDNRPPSFLTSVDLDSLAALGAVPWFPSHGRLLFFYDIDEQPWGFDPKDRGSWAVLHLDASYTGSATTGQCASGERYHVELKRFASPPSWERPDVDALALTDAEAQALVAFSHDRFEGAPHHQMGGYPSPVQSDTMEFDRQLASNGVYCVDLERLQDSRAGQLKQGAFEWRLPLQVESDDKLGLMWGDLGLIYFCIREQDARAGRFENTWLILKCT